MVLFFKCIHFNQKTLMYDACGQGSLGSLFLFLVEMCKWPAALAVMGKRKQFGASWPSSSNHLDLDLLIGKKQLGDFYIYLYSIFWAGPRTKWWPFCGFYSLPNIAMNLPSPFWVFGFTIFISFPSLIKFVSK